MRASLEALAEELKRLKATGVKNVPVSDESLARLRAVVAARSKAAGGAATTAAATLEPEPSSPRLRSTAPAPAPAPVAAPAAPAAPTLPPPPVVILPEGDKAARWEWLRERVASDPVVKERIGDGKRAGFGAGSLDATLFFVGDVPEAADEETGSSLTGEAGDLLTKMVVGMGLTRDAVYVTNIMNWRSRDVASGRHATKEELKYCLPYLKAQIEIVRPTLLVGLGTTAAACLLESRVKALGDVRGRWLEFSGLPLLITYHPSYLLRSQSKRSKRMVWEDLLKVMERAELPISEKQRGYFL